jgi:beta-lactamase regulating signal transducer with metallopeptidase domain
MHQSKLSRLAGNLLLAISLLLVPFTAQIFAQGNTGSSTTTSTQTSAPSAQSSQQTTTTTSKSTVPVETSRTTTTVDPLWIAVGAVALLAILAIAFLAMRGRSRDTVAVSTERETVVKRD